jgi:hypothetical protein
MRNHMIHTIDEIPGLGSTSWINVRRVGKMYRGPPTFVSNGKAKPARGCRLDPGAHETLHFFTRNSAPSHAIRWLKGGDRRLIADR